VRRIADIPDPPDPVVSGCSRPGFAGPSLAARRRPASIARANVRGLSRGAAAWHHRATAASPPQGAQMFTIEHDFDATVITLVDEGPAPLQEDVTVLAFDDCVTLEQFDPRSDEVVRITLSHGQVKDLAAALNLPEGVYRRKDVTR
jgi:hypothetical protein